MMMSKNCTQCGATYPEDVKYCPRCAYSEPTHSVQQAAEEAAARKPTQIAVKLTYIDLPFWNMVLFMVTAAFAAIPAIIIIWLIISLLTLMFGGLQHLL